MALQQFKFTSNSNEFNQIIKLDSNTLNQIPIRLNSNSIEEK